MPELFNRSRRVIFNDSGITITSVGGGFAYEVADDTRRVRLEGDAAETFRASILAGFYTPDINPTRAMDAALAALLPKEAAEATC